jgi:NADH:ubiquinone oxidoreductase subunit E
VSNAGASPFRVFAEHKADGIFHELESVQEQNGFISAKDMERVAERRGMRRHDVPSAGCQ